MDRPQDIVKEAQAILKGALQCRIDSIGKRDGI